MTAGVWIWIWCASLWAQSGGRHAFEFLRFPPSARLLALGGSNVSIYDGDPLSAVVNPAVLNDASHSKMSLTFFNFVADVNAGTVNYAHKLDKVGFLHAGIQYLNYGTFLEADVFGNTYGRFSAGDAAVMYGMARNFDRFSFGANFKMLHSHVAYQSAWGAALDFGGLWHHPRWDLGVGATLRNVGMQFVSLSGGAGFRLPFTVEIGVSKRIPHTPMRVSLTLTDLQQPVLFRHDPTLPPRYDFSGNPIPRKNLTGDNIFGHTVWALEFLITRYIHLRLAYNHRRRVEMRLENREGLWLGGFSVGAGLRLNRFYLDYGYAGYHVVGGMHQFSLAFHLNSFKRGWKPEPGVDPVKKQRRDSLRRLADSLGVPYERPRNPQLGRPIEPATPKPKPEPKRKPNKDAVKNDE
ncbi:MAG: type IX secretion system protein PorQ [Bacteroidia bacterium]|nr:type IX secretion system protein PorQ [Bacteroidia bacterium]